MAAISFPNSELPMDNGGPTSTVALTDQTPGAPFDHPAYAYGTTCLPKDQRGSGRPASACTVGAFEPDFTPPVVVLTQNPAPNAAGWHGSTVTSVQVVIGITETGSGVASTEYRISPATDWLQVPPAGLPPVAAEGSTPVEVRATDHDDNVSNIATTTVKIDRTAPTVSYAIAPDGSSVTFTVTDTGSQVKSLTVGGDPKPLDPNGQVTVPANMAASLAFTATDNADNQTSGTVDVKAPDVDILPDPAPNTAGWHRGPVAVDITSNDAGSDNTGVTSLTYQASGATTINQATVLNPVSPFRIPSAVTGEGTTTVTASAKDGDGNVGVATPLDIKIDKTAPTVVFSTTAAAQTGDVTMTFTLNDALSGVATLSYSLDGGDWVMPIPAAIVDSGPISSPGPHTVTIEVVDIAGNSTGYITENFTIEPLTIDVTLTTSAPSVQVGAVSAPLDSIVAGVAQLSESGTSVSSTPFSAIPFSAITIEDAPFSAIPFSAIPFSAIPFSAIPFSAIANPQPGTFSIPFSAIPFSAIPFSAIPFSAIGLEGTPFSAIGLDSTLLSELSTPDGQGLDAYLGGTPLEGTPLQALNLGDLMSLPFSAIDLSKSPFSAIPFSAIPFSAIDLSGVPFSAIPFSAIGDVLDCSGLTEQECLDLTLQQAQDSGRLKTDGTDSLLTVGDVLGLDDVNLNSTVLANLPFSAIALGSVSLNGIPFSAINTSGTTVTGLEAWCEVLGQVCADYNINPTTGDDNGVSLITLALSGVDLNNVPFSAIGLQHLPFSAIPLGLVPFSAINWESTPLGTTPFSAIPFSAIPFSAIGEIVDCTKVNCTSGTLADAQAANAFTDAFLASPISLLEEFDLTGYSLADLLFGMLPPEDLPWIEIDDLNSVRLPIADGNQSTFDYTVGFTVGNRNAGDVTVDLTLPVGFVPPLDAVATLAGTGIADGRTIVWTESSPGPGSNPPLVLTFNVGPLDAGSYSISLPVWAGVVLGDFVATADAVATRSTNTVTDSDSASINVTEAGEGLVSTQLQLTGSGTCLLNSSLEVSHISSSGDIDVYSFVVPPACTGGRIEVMMTNLAVDLDLTLLGPPVTAEYLRGSPTTGYGYIEDHSYDLNPDDDALDADVLRDIPVDAAKLGLPAASSLVPIAVSANRGTASERLEARTPRAGETYYIIASGFNGASTDLPFGMQAQFTGISSTTCTPPPLPAWSATSSALPSVTSLSPDLNTLVLYNRGWLEGSSDPSAPALLAKIADVGSSDWTELGVVGAAVPIDANGSIAADLNTWYSNTDGARCNPDAANDIVRGIGELIDSYTAGPDGTMGTSDDLPISNIVIVGDDSQVPFARLVDTTTYSNETDHAATIPEQGELKGALGAGYYFSDDPYGSAAGIRIADSEFFVPDRAVGRLVETPTQILGQFNDFLAYGGVLDATTGSGPLAAAAGYDFLKDGVDEIVSNMTADGFDFSPGVLNEQNGVLWNAQNLIDLLSVSGLSVASINAHFDQYRSLPSEGNATGDETDLFVVGDTAISRALLFSMGCHAGLSVSNVQIGASPVWASDWAESFGGLGDLWIGNSGYGYGDSAMVAYSESISASFGDFVGTNTVGQAWMLAKQDFASGMFVVSPYQTKSMNEWILYGFPMFRASADIPVQPELPMIGSGPGVIADPYGSGLNVAPVGLASTGLQLETTSAGQYYRGNAGTLEVRGRAVSALAEIDVTIPDGFGGLDMVAGGAIITELTSEVVPNFPALIFNPIVDLGDAENPSLSASERFPVPEAVFPAGLSQLVDHLGEDGQLRQSLLLAGTRYVPQGDGSTGRLEKFTSAQATVYYRPAGATDTTAPLFRTAEGVSDGKIAFFEIDVVGDGVPDDTLRVNVLFGPANPTAPVAWRSIDLVRVGTSTKWVGGAPVDPDWGAASSSYAFWVQACDTSGNCGSSTAKGVYFATTDTGGGEIVDIAIAENEINGWYPGNVTAVATSTAGDIDRYILDGVETNVTDTASLSIPVSGPGGHYLLVYDVEGNVGARLLAIDGTPPIANHNITPAPINGYNAAGATLSISAFDPFGSGIDRIEYSTDGFSTTPTSVFAPLASVPVNSTSTISYRAVDRVGNESSTVDVTISIDSTAPVVTATAATGINGGWSKVSPVSVGLNAVDEEVGVASIEYSYDGSTWDLYEVPFDVSSEGTTTINVRATDLLGNTGASDNVVVRIDTIAPTANITSPSGSYDQGATVSADFTCADAGSGVFSCVGSTANGSAIDTTVVGTFTFSVTATDNAGNETVKESTYSVNDVTAPVITILSPTGNPDFELGTSAATASYTCVDAVDLTPSCAGKVGSALVASGAALPTTAIGSFTLSVASTDASGNAASASATYRVVDTTAPTVSIGTSPAPIFNGWNKNTVTATVTATDLGGVATIEYRTALNGGSPTEWTSYLGPLSITAEGTTVIEARATDVSGNSGTANPVTVKIDKTGPTITSTVPTSVLVGSTPPTVQFTCADTGGSGVASCTSVPTQGTALSTTNPGSVSFTVTAVDNVGNSSTKTFTMEVKYKVCLLYNANKPQPSTGTVAIKLQLCDASNNNLSSSSIVLTAKTLNGSTTTPLLPQDSGSANPTFEFRYDANLAGYIYNLQVSALRPALGPGAHNLNFVVSTTGNANYDAKFTLR
ncbi:MAG: hypothetical protein OEY55_03985 [Acidimicrobiia bacterium]|nr:hypothetical protein [Acidimicrobiia bacterium]